MSTLILPFSLFVVLQRDAQERKSAVVKHLARHFGKEAREPIDYIEKDWAQEKYTKGCPVVNLPPGVCMFLSFSFCSYST